MIRSSWRKFNSQDGNKKVSKKEENIGKLVDNLDKSCFFIGAGFSKEFGMPLSSELSSLLLGWLTPEKLRDLNQKWSLDNLGYPNDLVTEACELLGNPDMNYEELIGILQEKFTVIRNNEKKHAYWGFINYLIELISLILIERHINNEKYFKKSIPNYRGLKFFSELSQPLWIFSLNQDFVIEMLSDELNINYCDGYDENNVEIFSLLNENAEKIGEFTFKKQFWDNINLEKMHFLPAGKKGINLLKIHGSLGEYTYLDESSLLKVKPIEHNIGSWLTSLKNANENLRFFLKGIPTIRSINEIQVTDKTGELQFLRRTLLAGKFKFSRQISQNAPKELILLFEEKLNYFENLIIIGYSLGDPHVNEIIKKWVRGQEKRFIYFIDPYMKSLPTNIKIPERKFVIMNYLASDFLDLCSDNELNNEEKILKAIRKKEYDKSIELFIDNLEEKRKIDLQIVLTFLKENNYSSEETSSVLQKFKEIQEKQFSKFLNKFKNIFK